MYRRVYLVLVVLFVNVFGFISIDSSDAANEPTYGILESFESGGWDTFIDTDGMSHPIFTGAISDVGNNNTAVVYSLVHSELPFGSKYRISTPDSVRSSVSDSARWLSATHKAIG
jgi:hypothetical protein